MEIIVEEHENDSITVSLSGSFGFQDHMSFNEFVTNIQDKKKSVSFDLKSLDMIDSAGIGMLFLAHKIIEQSNGSMVIRNPNGQVKRVFEITNLEDQIKVVSG